MSLVGFKAQNHPQQALRDDVDDRGTQPHIFEAFDERFGPFTLDVAAAAHNAKCARYFDRHTDGLRQSWAGERVWCNPPYSAIEPWVRKAWQEAPTARGIVMLLPANRTEQKWWQELVEPPPRQARLTPARRVPSRTDAVHPRRITRRRPERATPLRRVPPHLGGDPVTRLMLAWASWVRAWARTLNAPTERATSEVLASLRCPMCGGRP